VPTRKTKNRKFKWPLVCVRWVDSTSPRQGWLAVQDWQGVGSQECVSVGFLIAHDKKTKTIAPHLAYPDDEAQCQGNGIIVIPSAAITSTEYL
jgi:hypothetical protein